jgi:hypothetical protein
MSPAQYVTEVTDTLQALERCNARQARLTAKLHALLEAGVKEHGLTIGISPASIAPKD